MRRCNLVFSMGNDGNTYVVGTTWEHVNSNIEYFSGNPTFRLLRKETDSGPSINQTTHTLTKGGKIK